MSVKKKKLLGAQVKLGQTKKAVHFKTKKKNELKISILNMKRYTVYGNKI